MLYKVLPQRFESDGKTLLPQYVNDGKYIRVSRGVHNIEGSETLPYFTYRMMDSLIDTRVIDYAAKYSDIHAYLYNGSIAYRTQYVSDGELIVF
jgi:hypothetical protein